MAHTNKAQPKLPWIAQAPKTNKSWGHDTDFYRRKAWRNLRASKLRESPLCEHCKKEDRLISATVVDHIQPRRLSPELELAWDNLQSLCHTCHNIKSSAEGRGGSNRKNNASTNSFGLRDFCACKTGDLFSVLIYGRRKTIKTRFIEDRSRHISAFEIKSSSTKGLTWNARNPSRIDWNGKKEIH